MIQLSNFFSNIAIVWQDSGIDPALKYLVDETKRTFQGAQQFCTQHGGHLIKITEASVQNNVQSKVDQKTHSYIWVNGVQTVKNSGIFKWVDDNSTVTNISWGSGDPNQLDRDCVSLVIFKSGSNWFDAPCSDINTVVCEKRHIIIDSLDGTSPIEQLGQFVNRQLVNLNNQLNANQATIMEAFRTNVISKQSSNYSTALLMLNSALLAHGQNTKYNLTKLQQNVTGLIQLTSDNMTIKLDALSQQIQSSIENSNESITQAAKNLVTDFQSLKQTVLLETNYLNKTLAAIKERMTELSNEVETNMQLLAKQSQLTNRTIDQMWVKMMSEFKNITEHIVSTVNFSESEKTKQVNRTVNRFSELDHKMAILMELSNDIAKNLSVSNQLSSYLVETKMSEMAVKLNESQLQDTTSKLILKQDRIDQHLESIRHAMSIYHAIIGTVVIALIVLCGIYAVLRKFGIKTKFQFDITELPRIL